MIVEKVQETHHDFWIDREEHYQDHIALRDMRKRYGTASRIFWSAFLGFVVLGAITLAVIGFISWADVKAVKVLSK